MYDYTQLSASFNVFCFAEDVQVLMAGGGVVGGTVVQLMPASASISGTS